eukprot:708826-Hanusia_phi.AAC.4
MDEEGDVKKKKKKKVSGIHLDDTILVSEKLKAVPAGEVQDAEKHAEVDGGKRDEDDADIAFDLPSSSHGRGTKREKQGTTPTARELEQPAPGCPKLSLPSLNEFVSEKEKEDLFNSLSRELLQYVSSWPEAAKYSKQVEQKHSKQRSDSKSNVRQQPEAYQVPAKTRQTAEHLFAALKKWLSRTWQKGVSFNNTYHVGVLMEKDVETLRRGRDPIFATKLETVWNGDGFEVASVPVLDIDENDWLSLSHKFKTKHVTGDNFFPSESYQAKLDVQDLFGRNDAMLQDVAMSSPQLEAEEDTTMGVHVQLEAQTSQINLNTDADGRFFAASPDQRNERVLRPYNSEPILPTFQMRAIESYKDNAMLRRSVSLNKGNHTSKQQSTKSTKSLALDKPFMEFAR